MDEASEAKGVSDVGADPAERSLDGERGGSLPDVFRLEGEVNDVHAWG